MGERAECRTVGDSIRYRYGRKRARYFYNTGFCRWKMFRTGIPEDMIYTARYTEKTEWKEGFIIVG